MDDRHTEPARRPCTLREACVGAGLDRGGRRCALCPLRELCESELRWLVQTAPMPPYPN